MMPTRRGFAHGVAAAGALCLLPNQAKAQVRSAFDKLFDEALHEPTLLTGGADREGRALVFEEQGSSRAIAPRTKPSKTPVSENATKLIILFEVTRGALYDKRYQHPVWPGGQSGVTVGVGYDLGYVKPIWLHEDWDGLVDPKVIAALTSVCGLTGPAAKAALPKVEDVTIPWTIADRQFRTSLLPRYVGETLEKLPNARKLSPDCLGSMVSLVYNRGPSFRNARRRYAEMRAIRRDMETENHQDVPAQLLNMRHLWSGNPSMRGLVKRRELEAALFQQGLPTNS